MCIRDSLIGPGPQLGGQRDLIPDLQRMDLPEVVVDASVVGGQRHIAIPEGCFLEMALEAIFVLR